VTPPPLRTLWLGRVPYAEALGLQRELAAARRDGRLGDDCVLLLEHPAVFTVGRGGSAEHVPGGPERLRSLGAEYVEVDRGGSVTFHGPGQLVAYPIVDLPACLPAAGGRVGDVGAYLRALETALCEVCAEAGVAATPRPPYTGAWVGREKVAAIGVKLASGVTQHGVALNVDVDLRWFEAVVPCGIARSEGGVTSLARCGATAATVAGLAPRLAARLAAGLGRRAVPVASVADLGVAAREPVGAAG
jgi:lipoyl(octanoyl) transferase